MANRYYNPAAVNTNILSVTPNLKLYDDVLTTLQGDYDALVTESLRFPEHWAKDRQMLQTEIQRREGKIDDLAEQFASKNFMTGRVGMRKLARDYKKDWNPGGVYHQASVRKQQVDAYKKQVAEDLKDAPVVAAMVIDQMEKTSEPIINPDGSFGKVNTPNYVKNYTDEEVNDYLNENLKQIKDTALESGKYSARKISGAETWHELRDAMGRDFFDVYNVLKDRMPREMLAAIQQRYDADRYFDPSIPEMDVRKNNVTRGADGSYIPEDPNNPLIDYMFGAAKGRARTEFKYRNTKSTDHSYLERLKRQTIEWERALDRPELRTQVFQQDLGMPKMPSKHDVFGKKKVTPKSLKEYAEGEKVGIGIDRTVYQIWKQPTPEEQQAAIQELRDKNPLFDHAYSRIEADPTGAFGSYLPEDKYEAAVKEYERLKHVNSMQDAGYHPYGESESEVRRMKNDRQVYIENGQLANLKLIPLSGQSSGVTTWNDALNEQIGEELLEKTPELKTKATFITGEMNGYSHIAPGGKLVTIINKKGNPVQYAAVPDSKGQQIRMGLSRLAAGVYSPTNEVTMGEVRIPAADNTFDTEVLAVQPFDMRQSEIMLNNIRSGRYDGKEREPSAEEWDMIHRLARNPELDNQGKGYEFYQTKIEEVNGVPTRVPDFSKPKRNIDGTRLTLQDLGGYADDAVNASIK